MVQSLEQYVAQATQAYQPAVNAIQSQLDSLSGRLETTNQQINKNYAQQQAELNRNRNAAAETASMQAAGSGGSFGGSANLANRRYYDQSFVPAVTKLQTNQANDLASARQASEDQRTSLNTQLANMQAQANQSALAQYYADQEAERAREAQLKAARISAAASNPWQYLPDGYQNSRGVKTWDFGNGYYLQDNNGVASYYKADGTPVKAGEFLLNTSGTGANWDLWKDVWNNGVSTTGVGSDTISAYEYSRNPWDAKYNYLWQ